MADPDLDKAYALESPEDNRALYADWAATYDSDFAAEMDYQLPSHVADAFRRLWTPDAGQKVLDVGAGTGLLGERLKDLDLALDALDISSEMLATAAQKQVYAKLIEADLTQPLEIGDDAYDAVVSAGTFTHGHVGPDAFDELIRVARPGAIFALAINDAHFAAHGFDAKLAALSVRITELAQVKERIYGPGAAADHADDLAQIVTFKVA